MSSLSSCILNSIPHTHCAPLCFPQFSMTNIMLYYFKNPYCSDFNDAIVLFKSHSKTNVNELKQELYKQTPPVGSIERL